MAEVEYGGVKLSGGKLLLILPLLGTLGGGLWAGFEFYKDYSNMKDIIANIDTGQVNARMDVINTKLDEALDYSRDIKNGLRDDIVRLEKIIDKVEDDINEVETKTRTLIDDAETRFDTKRDDLLNQYVAQKDMLIRENSTTTELHLTLLKGEKDFAKGQFKDERSIGTFEVDATTITLDSTANLSATGGIILVDSELITYTGISGSNLTHYNTDIRSNILRIGPEKGFKKYDLNVINDEFEAGIYYRRGKDKVNEISSFTKSNVVDDSYFFNLLNY